LQRKRNCTENIENRKLFNPKKAGLALLASERTYGGGVVARPFRLKAIKVGQSVIVFGDVMR